MPNVDLAKVLGEVLGQNGEFVAGQGVPEDKGVPPEFKHPVFYMHKDQKFTGQQILKAEEGKTARITHDDKGLMKRLYIKFGLAAMDDRMCAVGTGDYMKKLCMLNYVARVSVGDAGAKAANEVMEDGFPVYMDATMLKWIQDKGMDMTTNLSVTISVDADCPAMFFSLSQLAKAQWHAAGHHTIGRKGSMLVDSALKRLWDRMKVEASWLGELADGLEVSEATAVWTVVHVWSSHAFAWRVYAALLKRDGKAPAWSRFPKNVTFPCHEVHYNKDTDWSKDKSILATNILLRCLRGGPGSAPVHVAASVIRGLVASHLILACEARSVLLKLYALHYEIAADPFSFGENSTFLTGMPPNPLNLEIFEEAWPYIAAAIEVQEGKATLRKSGFWVKFKDVEKPVKWQATLEAYRRSFSKISVGSRAVDVILGTVTTATMSELTEAESAILLAHTSPEHLDEAKELMDKLKLIEEEDKDD